MKTFNLPVLIILALAEAASLAAQSVRPLPPPPAAITPQTIISMPVKMLFAGAIKARSFEMTLVRDGDYLRGRYFFVKRGRSSSRAVRGEIGTDGKIVLREYDRANKPAGEFRGTLTESADDFDLNFEGEWESGARVKSLNFYAVGQIIGLTGERRIENVYISEKSVRRRYAIDAAYPQIAGGNSAGVKGFNLSAKQSVVEPIAEFKRRIRRQTAEDIKNLPDDGNTYSVSFYIKYADDRLISVAYFYTENSDGMPRPMDYVGMLNYDLEKKRELNLADLFKPGAKYLETISAYCLKILRSRPPENDRKLADSDWEKGVKAETDNYYDNWNLISKGLLITFNEYQLAPYSAGTQSVLIPYSELKNIAKPGGALAKMSR